jgi:hypothetical protein
VHTTSRRGRFTDWHSTDCCPYSAIIYVDLRTLTRPRSPALAFGYHYSVFKERQAHTQRRWCRLPRKHGFPCSWGPLTVADYRALSNRKRRFLRKDRPCWPDPAVHDPEPVLGGPIMSARPFVVANGHLRAPVHKSDPAPSGQAWIGSAQVRSGQRAGPGFPFDTFGSPST